MKLWIMSDLHQEFDEFAWRPQHIPDHDVLILAGDIDVPGVKSVAYAKTLTEKPIVLIAGNHEGYGQEIEGMLTDMREAARSLSNVHFLENDSVAIGGVVFIGATLWTDLRIYEYAASAAVIYDVRKGMNDYRRIKVLKSDGKRRKRLDPLHTIRFHQASRAFIEKEMRSALHDGSRSVVVTHHAPTIHGVAPDHRNTLMSAAYASNLSDLIESGKPALWIHGHTHHCHETMIGRTRVVSNARGYDETSGRAFDDQFTIEI